MTRASVAAWLIATLALSGCAASAGGTKAGGAPAPVTLRVGTDDPQGRPSTEQLARFSQEVAEASDGRVRIEPVWRAAGETGEDDFDQKVARLVVSGQLDLALVPSRAWDTEGVSSLRAINAPFLLTSKALTGRVVSSGLADQMLDGLSAVGVRGLALLPEDMRYVMAFDEPMTSLADFKGARIRVPASSTTYATFAALGALPDDVSASGDAIRRGDVAAVESEFAVTSTYPRLPRYATGNLPLWPKINSLVVNAARYDHLAPEVRSALEAGARRTRDWVLAQPDHLDADVQRYCRSGGTVTYATAAELAELRAASAPVTAQLQRDQTTRSVMAEISAMAARDRGVPDVAPACLPAATPSGSQSASLLPGTFQALPQGSFRALVPAGVLRRAGVSESETHDHAGTWTLTFDKGQLTIEDTNDATGVVSRGNGIYCADGRQLAASLADSPGQKPTSCGTFFVADWDVTGDELRLSGVRAGSPDSAVLLAALFGSTPFQRVR